jgi:hypothetical protein
MNPNSPESTLMRSLRLSTALVVAAFAIRSHRRVGPGRVPMPPEAERFRWRVHHP